MNAHSLSVLEFDKIRAQVVTATFSPGGRRRALALAPDLPLEAILLSQERTSEWRAIELTGDAPGPAEVADLEPLLIRLERGGGTLEGAELYAFVPLLVLAGDLRRMHERLTSGTRPSPRLIELCADLGEFSSLRARLLRSVASSGEILDTASPALARARRELIESQKRASELLDGLLDRLTSERESAFVTLREGRYVLSVRTQHRGLYSGILHGRSQTGQSVLLEPLEALEVNNAVADRREEVVREELRVLDELTESLRAATQPLARALEVIGVIDLVRAQARTALALRAEPPTLNQEGRLRIASGRHPLLAAIEERGGPRVVPLDLEWDRERPVVVLSGPNMGGKTVALKTVGLLTAMARAGLFVPAGPGTDLPLVDDIFVDLGDEQSIEGELSTFAGHLKNIGETWERATGESLVLFDELGSGTDPDEGAALGMALLEGLAERRALTLATTHLTALKLFAEERPAMQNASMEFDSVSLRPRYLLRMGEAGRSRALEIARRMFPESSLLPAVERYRSPLQIQLDRIYAEVELEKERLAAAREEFESETVALRESAARRDRQAAKLRERIESLRRDRDASVRGLYAEAREALAKERAALEAELRAQSSERRVETLRRAERGLLRREAEQEPRARPRHSGRRLDAQAITPGMRAWIADLDDSVRVLRVSDDGRKAWVEWHGRRLEIDVRRLEQPPEGASPRRAQPSVRIEETAALTLPRELDLRGQSAAEAIEKLERHLDLAARHGIALVRIIHGKGTGTLKREVERLIARHPLVVSFRQGEPAEGGWGVTIAELGSTAR